VKAITYDAYGGPEVLGLADVDDPKLGPDAVLVRVRSAGVNPIDAKVRSGARDASFPVNFPVIPGWDVAGVVEKVGPAVTEFAQGDEIVGYVRKDHIQNGTYAQLVAAPVRTLAHKPRTVGWVEAGGLPLAGLTAWQALRAARVGDGDTVLVHAAAGGVGAFAVQLARVLGAEVLGTASDTNHDFLRSLGATPLTYGDGLAERVRSAAPAGITAAVDLVGGDALSVSAELLGDASRIVSIIDAAAVKQLGGRYVFVRPSTEDLAELCRLVDAGQLTVHVAETFPLGEAAQAHRAIESGHGRGKIVLEVG
jgi:NADPH:quinone reductase-like Zn-dependent oxidoreductase